MGDVDEVVSEFLVESHEGLDQLDRDLVALEADPGSLETIASIFRTIHTIKGTCGFLGFTTLERVAHVGESLLSRLREGELRVDGEVAAALLALSDALRSMLAEIEATGGDGADRHDALLATLSRLKDGASPAAAPTSKLGEILVERGIATPEQVAAAVARQLAGDTRRLGEIIVDLGVPAEQVAEALDRQGEARAASVVDTSIRVDVSTLDELVSLVAALAQTRDELVRRVGNIGDQRVDGALRRLDAITNELQWRAMRTRVQPIGGLLSRFERVARDVAGACGKKVRVELDGEGTELDRTIIESIRDPLTHLVRNAVDHGIETPERRAAAGKDAEGRLVLRASQLAEEICIEVADDGAGIDLERIRAKAVERGIVDAAGAATMAEEDVIDLIFVAGLTTADTLTNVSGRGVGMDVVRSSIEPIGGRIDVASTPGAGTSFRITIPVGSGGTPVTVPGGAPLSDPVPAGLPVDDDDVVRVVADVWSATVGLAVEPATTADLPCPTVTAVVHISGDCEVSVSVECPRTLAERAAAVMFGVGSVTELRCGDVEDALGELANMIGGGIKSVLHGTGRLSLPTVVEGSCYHLDVPGTVPVRHVWLSCDSSALVVRLYERAAVPVL